LVRKPQVVSKEGWEEAGLGGRWRRQTGGEAGRGEAGRGEGWLWGNKALGDAAKAESNF